MKRFSGRSELSFIGCLKKTVNEILAMRYRCPCVWLTNRNNISADIVKSTPLIVIFEKDSDPNFIIDSNRLQKIEKWLPPSSSLVRAQENFKIVFHTIWFHHFPSCSIEIPSLYSPLPTSWKILQEVNNLFAQLFCSPASSLNRISAIVAANYWHRHLYVLW